jgi:hypothetical protein
MAEAARRPVPWQWLGLLIAGLSVTAAMGWNLWPRPPDPLSVGSRPVTAQPAARPVAGERRRIRLFYPQESGEGLKEEEREIARRPTLPEEVRAVLQELTRGNVPGTRPPLPPGIEVRQVFLDALGIVYLDFSRGMQAVTAAPGAQAELAVSAILTTLITSFSEVKRVRFLVEGQELTGAAGGLDLRRPLSARFPGGAVPTVISQPQE